MDKLLTATFAILFALPTVAEAQPIWTRPQQERHLSVEVLKPVFDRRDVSVLTSAVFLAGRLPLTETTLLVGEVPFAYYGETGPTIGGRPEEDDASAAIGNPYIGFEVKQESGGFAEVGVRLPIGSNNRGVVAGQAAEFSSRQGAFLGPDRFFAQALANYEARAASPFRFRVRGGPAVAFSLNASDLDQVLFLKYSAQGWYDSEPVIMGAGLTGIARLNGEGGGFGERTVHHIGFTFIGDFEAARPGLIVRAPIDSSLNNTVTVIFGLSLTVPL